MKNYQNSNFSLFNILRSLGLIAGISKAETRAMPNKELFDYYDSPDYRERGSWTNLGLALVLALSFLFVCKVYSSTTENMNRKFATIHSAAKELNFEKIEAFGAGAKKMVIRDYLHDFGSKAMTEETLENSRQLYYATNPDSVDTKQLAALVKKNYSEVFRHSSFGTKLNLITSYTTYSFSPVSLILTQAEVDSMIAQLEANTRKAVSLEQLDDDFLIWSTFIENNEYYQYSTDSLQLETIRKIGSALVMKNLNPELKKVTNFAQLNSFSGKYLSGNGYFFYKEIHDKFMKKQAYFHSLLPKPKPEPKAKPVVKNKNDITEEEVKNYLRTHCGCRFVN